MKLVCFQKFDKIFKVLLSVRTWGRCGTRKKCHKFALLQGEEEKKDFTFDFSYWSFNSRDRHFATQEKVIAIYLKVKE